MASRRTREWKKSLQEYCLPISIKPANKRFVVLLLLFVYLSPAIWFAYYISFSGFLLCAAVGGVALYLECGALIGTPEISLIRISSNGKWLLVAEEGGQHDVILIGSLRTGSLVILKFKQKRIDCPGLGSQNTFIGNIRVLIVRKQPSTVNAFHRLNLYLTQ